jgi:hypothetical protein
MMVFFENVEGFDCKRQPGYYITLHGYARIRDVFDIPSVPLLWDCESGMDIFFPGGIAFDVEVLEFPDIVDSTLVIEGRRTKSDVNFDLVCIVMLFEYNALSNF